MPDRSLSALLAETDVIARHGPAPARPISQISQDSRWIDAGGCFVAVPGFRVDGHDYLAQAVGGGAVCLVVQRDRRAQWAPLAERDDVALVEVEDSRVALADLAAAFHGFPARRLRVVGVTGTDGKSTTCYLLAAMLEAAGHPTGLIGGVQFKVGDEWRMNTITQTSPEAELVQALLAEIVEAGATHVIVESTSHGLALHRLDHCEYDIGVFTGLSDDHLDFHGTREAYFDAKLTLFRALDRASDKGLAKRGVIFANEPHAAALRAATRASFVTAGFDKQGADISVSDLGLRPTHTELRIATPAGALATRLALPGRFNVGNALLAAGAAYALGLGPVPIAQGMRDLTGVPGRMEAIDAGQPFPVVVDAAATTDAFRTVLESLRPLVGGRLIVVFGCAGERDPGRRAGMGAAAAALADYSLLTSENPRSEEPAAIVRTIAAAMEAAGQRAGRDFEEEPDRRAAIGRALALAGPDDYVLIAGKGAEQTLIFADRVEPWDDRAVAREWLTGGSG